MADLSPVIASAACVVNSRGVSRAVEAELDIGAWLQGLGLESYEPAFRANAIDGSVLHSLTAEDLKDLGITLVGHRRSQLDPEDLREVIGAYHRAVSEIVRSFGGFVAKYMGDGILVYFGYPQAHED